MPSSYVNDLRIEEQATGENSGTWGAKVNSAFSQISEAFGYGTKQLSADSDQTLTMPDGTSDGTRAIYLKITSAVSLTATRVVTLGPNTVSKLWIVENATTGSQSISIKQGSGATVTIPNGQNKVLYSDGAGSGAAVVDAFTDLSVPSLYVSGNMDVDGTANLDVVDIDGAVDMASTLTLADDLTVDSGTLFVDVSANRVGVNTTAPAYDLDVDSTIHIGDDGGSGFTHARAILSSNGAARGIGTFYHNQVNDVEWYCGNPYDDTDSWSINRQATASHADSTANVTNALMSVDGSGNVLIGGTSTPSSSAGNLALFNGTAPSGSATNGIVLYAEDVSSSSELKVRDEAGNVTTLSPHNFELIPEGPSEEMAWSYFSERDGRRINVDILKAIRVLERLSGEKLVFES